MPETFDSDLPRVDLDFLIGLCKDNPKVEKVTEVRGFLITILLSGANPVFKRAKMFSRETEKEVDYDRATALAIRIGKTEELNQWLKDHKGFNHG